MNALATLTTRRAELAAQLEAAKQFLAGFDSAIALLAPGGEDVPEPRTVNRRKALPKPAAPSEAPKKPGRPRNAAAAPPTAEEPAEKKRGLIDRAELEKMWADNKPAPEIAAHFGVTESAIYMAKKNWGLPVRGLLRQAAA